jgi:hypothetical protein
LIVTQGRLTEHLKLPPRTGQNRFKLDALRTQIITHPQTSASGHYTINSAKQRVFPGTQKHAQEK